MPGSESIKTLRPARKELKRIYYFERNKHFINLGSPSHPVENPVPMHTDNAVAFKKLHANVMIPEKGKTLEI